MNNSIGSFVEKSHKFVLLVSGHQKHFHSGYPSRIRRVSMDNIRDSKFLLDEITKPDPDLYWTPKSYDQIIGESHLIEIKPTASECEDMFVNNRDIVGNAVEQDTFGLREPCRFNQLRSFHCISSRPLDLFHDILEVIWRTSIIRSRRKKKSNNARNGQRKL